MPNIRRAVIDVGTNSVKLLVADVTGHEVLPVMEDSRQTRLGKGFYELRRLQPEAVRQTAEVVGAYAVQARELNSQSVRVIATSAARDATNTHELTSAIEHVSGLKVEIISGEQEADWVFQGVTTDPALARIPLLLLDVGGGSSEFILGHGEHKHFRQSFPLGTVRLLEKFPNSDPPAVEEFVACHDWLKAFLQNEVRSALGPAMRRETKVDPRHRDVQLVGSGGTTTILARMELKTDSYERERIESVRLSLTQVREHRSRLWSMPLEERRHIPGLPPKRADVILTGVAIYEAVMEEFEFAELRVSTRGLRYAAVMQ